MNIGFIGVGHMGGAILRGYLPTAKKENQEILIYGRSKEKISKIGKELGVGICDKLEEILNKSQIIILGVKPIDFKDLLAQMKDIIAEDAVIISVAAGITIEYIKENLGGKGKVIRVMPNIPALINQGVTSISREDAVDDEMFEVARNIFAGVGKVFEVPEDMIHTVIGVSGSSPAYTYMYIDGLACAAQKRGMKREEALAYATYSVIGAAMTVAETGVDPDQLKKEVCSPNGTTIEAVKKLEELGFYEIIDKAFGAACERSKEITK